MKTLPAIPTLSRSARRYLRCCEGSRSHPCSAKTTVAAACAAVDDLVVHDFEVGVPADADTVWPQSTLEHWVRRALECQARGLDLLLTGQSPLGEVLATPSASLLDGSRSACLTRRTTKRLARLSLRDPGKLGRRRAAPVYRVGAVAREHAADPRARQQAITFHGWAQMRWERCWTGWTAGDDRWCTTTIDTTGIESLRQAPGSARG